MIAVSSILESTDNTQPEQELVLGLSAHAVEDEWLLLYTVRQVSSLVKRSEWLRILLSQSQRVRPVNLYEPASVITDMPVTSNPDSRFFVQHLPCS
jgi:hypothetical protein